MKLLSIIGHFGFGRNLLNGQTVKTKILADELERRYGEEEVLRIDTHGGAKTLFKAPFQVLRALKKSKNVIILPAHNGLRVNAPLLTAFRWMFRGRRLHYVVIGGWLPAFLQHRKALRASLKRFDGIYVETNTMRRALEAQGFQNVWVLPNCKRLTPLCEEELVEPVGPPYRVCTFSRVTKEKGIGDAVEAVRRVNEQMGYTAYTLDIYGPIDPAQADWFAELQTTFPSYVAYRGEVAFDRSVEVLKDYFALLFPTHHYTEGIPGTILDAYAAGVPVISARWESFSDLIEDDVTGVGYTFDDFEALVEVLLKAALSPQDCGEKKGACLAEAKKYLPEQAIMPLVERL